MPIKNDYQRVARRSLTASSAVLTANIQEKSAFLSYHALESTGTALSIHHNLPYGMGVGHNRKITLFMNVARRHRSNAQVLRACVEMVNLRNLYLYPIENHPTHTVILPENALSIPEARSLLRRVEYVVNWVDPKII